MTHTEHAWQLMMEAGEWEIAVCERCALYRVSHADAKPIYLVNLAAREYVCTGLLAGAPQTQPDPLSSKEWVRRATIQIATIAKQLQEWAEK